MKRKKLPWRLRFENLRRKPMEMLEDWFVGQVEFAIDQKLNNNVFFLDDKDDIIDSVSTLSANYQIGMIVYIGDEVKQKFLISRIEVSKNCHSWYIYGKVVN